MVRCKASCWPAYTTMLAMRPRPYATFLAQPMTFCFTRPIVHSSSLFPFRSLISLAKFQSTLARQAEFQKKADTPSTLPDLSVEKYDRLAEISAQQQALPDLHPMGWHGDGQGGRNFFFLWRRCLTFMYGQKMGVGSCCLCITLWEPTRIINRRFLRRTLLANRQAAKIENASNGGVCGA